MALLIPKRNTEPAQGLAPSRSPGPALALIGRMQDLKIGPNHPQPSMATLPFSSIFHMKCPKSDLLGPLGALTLPSASSWMWHFTILPQQRDQDDQNQKNVLSNTSIYRFITSSHQGKNKYCSTNFYLQTATWHYMTPEYWHRFATGWSWNDLYNVATS